MSAAALNARHLTVAPAVGAPPAQSDLNFEIAPNTRVALIGANGTGKTTLLKTFAGLLPPVAGEALVEGEPARCGNPRLAFLAQRSQIEWRFPVTVAGAVFAGRYPRLGSFRRLSDADRQRAADALELLELTPFADRPLDALSGRQQQRVLLARALCQEPAILLLDEPFNALDTASREILRTFLNSAPARNLTILTATHDLASLASDYDAVIQLAPVA